MISLSILISISIFLKDFLSISISIFSELPYRYRFRYRYFPELPYRYRYRYFQKWPYRYRYRYFSKVSIYRQSIFDIDISNRATPNPYSHPFYFCLLNHSSLVKEGQASADSSRGVLNRIVWSIVGRSSDLLSSLRLANESDLLMKWHQAFKQKMVKMLSTLHQQNLK